MIERLQSYPRLLRLALIGFGLWGIHEVLASILWRNSMANLYPPEADSTSIPLIGNLFSNIVYLPFYLTIVLLPYSSLMGRRPGGRRCWQWGLMFWLGLSYFLTIMYAMATMAEWGNKDHYPISIAAGALLLLLLGLLWRDRHHFRKNPNPGLSCQEGGSTPPT
jgi:hypothetical protein